MSHRDGSENGLPAARLDPGRLRLLPRHSAVDRKATADAVRDLLAALGEDVESDRLRDTPRRVADAYAELLTPAPFQPTTFRNSEGYDELVIVRDIPFHSLCEHHLLPFHGLAHLAYLPGERIVGLSKLGRVVELYARRLQVQERLTTQARTGSRTTSARRGWASWSRPSTCACRCAACRSPAPGR
jgi:GTP cyclohydrolase IA